MREGLGEDVLFGDSRSETVEEAVKEPWVLQPRSDKKGKLINSKTPHAFQSKTTFLQNFTRSSIQKKNQLFGMKLMI